MTISTADVLENGTALSEFTAASATPGTLTPAPVTPAQPVPQAIPIQRVSTERAVSTRRRVRVDWYQIAVILLILASGALGIYRLAWAMQP